VSLDEGCVCVCVGKETNFGFNNKIMINIQ